VHHVDRRGHVFDRRRRQYAVTEVEDVPETPPGTSQDILYTAFDFMERRK
jgi:hypothetical protein